MCKRLEVYNKTLKTASDSGLFLLKETAQKEYNPKLCTFVYIQKHQLCVKITF